MTCVSPKLYENSQKKPHNLPKSFTFELFIYMNPCNNYSGTYLFERKYPVYCGMSCLNSYFFFFKSRQDDILFDTLKAYNKYNMKTIDIMKHLAKVKIIKNYFKILAAKFIFNKKIPPTN